ncbi:hypothetical protein B0H14DRAFT_2590459 [Mycena olivaceomarginata]|nr:hypothetical protein B0H14DRAFT_2590459 [Mycena olivaceomarginata]
MPKMKTDCRKSDAKAAKRKSSRNASPPAKLTGRMHDPAYCSAPRRSAPSRENFTRIRETNDDGRRVQLTLDWLQTLVEDGFDWSEFQMRTLIVHNFHQIADNPCGCGCCGRSGTCNLDLGKSARYYVPESNCAYFKKFSLASAEKTTTSGFSRVIRSIGGRAHQSQAADFEGKAAKSKGKKRKAGRWPGRTCRTTAFASLLHILICAISNALQTTQGVRMKAKLCTIRGEDTGNC